MSGNRQVALIVGGSTGVGRATAARLLDQGVTDIAIAGRNADRGETAANELRAAGANAKFIAADANDPHQVGGLVDAVESYFGGIDILVVSTAADVVPRPLGQIKLDEIQGILNGQALSSMLMSRAALPALKRRGGGAVVLVASDAAKSATPGESVIGAAAAAITMFGRAFALEAKRDGIRVNVLTPSIISGTPLYDRLMKDEFSAKLFGRAEQLASLGVVTADDVAAIIAFLCGPEASRITGQAISVNGGISAA